MKSYEWTNLGREIGFVALTNGINFKNAIHEAYFTQLSLPAEFKNLEQNDVEKIIKRYWNKIILRDRATEYSGHLSFGDLDEIPVTLGLLCAIASIHASNMGTWRM